MLSALMFTVRSMRAALLSEEHLFGPFHPQPKVISLGRDELPDYLLRDLGTFDGNRSDWETCHPVRPLAGPADVPSTRGASGGIAVRSMGERT